MAKLLVTSPVPNTGVYMVSRRNGVPVELHELKEGFRGLETVYPEEGFDQYLSVDGFQLHTIGERIPGDVVRGLKQLAKKFGWKVTKVSPDKLPVIMRGM